MPLLRPPRSQADVQKSQDNTDSDPSSLCAVTLHLIPPRQPLSGTFRTFCLYNFGRGSVGALGASRTGGRGAWERGNAGSHAHVDRAPLSCQHLAVLLEHNHQIVGYLPWDALPGLYCSGLKDLLVEIIYLNSSPMKILFLCYEKIFGSSRSIFQTHRCAVESQTLTTRVTV